VLPDGTRDDLGQDVLTSAASNVAHALHRCHHALELDGELHAYEAGDSHATVYDIASAALQSARHDQDPPTVVRQAPEPISWLSRAILELDQDSAETAAALAEALSRLVLVWVFANDARASQPADP
jgi:hypothetical protein